MTVGKRPLRRSMMIAGAFFLFLMCVLLAFQSAGMLKTSLNQRYVAHLENIVTYVESITDADDLRECIRTLQPSEKYNELQRQVNLMVDDFEVEYIYIAVPTEHILYSVLSSTSQAEIAAGDTEDYPIMYYDESYYTVEDLAPYNAAMNKAGEYSAFVSGSEFYPDSYTVCKPLADSNGEVFALICADVNLYELRSAVNSYIHSSVLITLLTVGLFAIGSMLWLRSYVTRPVGELERSAREFAQKSHERVDLDDLKFNAPNFFRGDEIQSLSESIQQMSEDMKGYVEDFLSAQKRVENAEEEIEGMTKFANEDALTHAMSKVAYDARKAELAEHIAAGNAQFAIVMIDLNNLKRINDIYGLENGNKYIVSGCDIIRSVYRDIPVYRIGGDQFVVILEGDAYKDCDELYAVLEERFRHAQEDTERELWERCSAAAGMTEFFPDADQDVDQVYRRAEMIMTRNKRIMKNQTGI